ncbi:MAG TPA: site-specific integrase [Nitrososphaeraceae archaeon]|nr:site-specific integrase [Nitrososphaeraceae archaeon]
MMPSQNRYWQQKQGTELTCASSTVEEDLERKIDKITTYQKPYIRNIFIKMARANPRNATILHDYVIAQKNEQNIKESTIEGIIKKLVWLSTYLGDKSYDQMTKDDLLNYLNSIKKPSEEDPTHKSIGTYNGRRMTFSTFFRWLYNPDEPNYRKRIAPPCMRGIRRLPRLEKSPYKPTDLWTGEEHGVFLKYCPDKRDRCYHSMANDTSARPHELLTLRIKDVIFKTSNSGVQYGEIQVSGKTKSRTLPIINSIVYLKDWLREHPTSDNDESWLFVVKSHNNYGQQLSEKGLCSRYNYYYKSSYFPRLIKDETVSPRDKSYIKTMLMKPWNPYVFRHSALTEKSQILKESTLRDHAGWSNTSQMPNIYIHYFGNESSNSLLEVHGIKNTKGNTVNLFRPRYCPNCSEPNKPETRFCAKCGMVLTFDAYNEAVEEKRLKDTQIEVMMRKQEQFEQVLQSLIDSGQLKPQSHNVLGD